jgi:hypothetical protein
MTVPGQNQNPSSVFPSPLSPLRREARNTETDSDRKKFSGLYTGPYFDPNLPSNISAQVGDSAILMCNVHQVGRKTVS